MAHSESLKRPRGIVLAALLMIVFGAAEVATGFTHNFVGISTSPGAVDTYTSVAIGSFYSIAGLLILTFRRRAAEAA